MLNPKAHAEIMTIVVDCFAKDAAFQVSDRRLTDLHGKIFDDQRNKAVIVNGRLVFSYTGLAHIDGQRTDLWLAKAIAECATSDMSAVANHVRDKATVALSKIHCPSQFKRHAFRGTGWFRLKDEGWLSPGLITIHNSFDHTTGAFLDYPLPEFKVASFFPTELRGSCYMKNVGVTPTPAERATIFRLIRKCSKNPNATRGAVLHGLIRAVQWLSTHRGYTTIGSNVMAICIPKACVERFEGTGSYTFAGGNPQDTLPTFLYVNTDGFASSTFAPIFINGNKIIMRKNEVP